MEHRFKLLYKLGSDSTGNDTDDGSFLNDGYSDLVFGLLTTTRNSQGTATRLVNADMPAVIKTVGYTVVPNSSLGAPGERKVRTSRTGGWPNNRLYSRLN
jgi:hypothetical protein